MTKNHKSSELPGIGVIGCGERILTVFDQIQRSAPDLAITAVCDPSPEAVANARARFPSVRVFENHVDLARDPSVKFVMIGSWNAYHKEHAIAALEAGKDVFCEKPLATTPEDCIAIRDAWARSERSFTIGFTLRYSPHYRAIKKCLESGALGRIISMEFNETLMFGHGGFIHSDWRRFTQNAGTFLLEKCCHDVDIARWLVGSEAQRVASFGGLSFFRPEYRQRMDEIGKDPATGLPAYNHFIHPNAVDAFTADKDIVDHQVAIIEYSNGVKATFHTNCNTALPERRLYLCGTHGTLRADVLDGTIELKRIGFGVETEEISSGVSGQHGGGDEVLGASLARTILNGEPPLTTLDDGLKAALTCFGIDEAKARGCVVELPKR